MLGRSWSLLAPRGDRGSSKDFHAVCRSSASIAKDYLRLIAKYRPNAPVSPDFFGGGGRWSASFVIYFGALLLYRDIKVLILDKLRHGLAGNTCGCRCVLTSRSLRCTVRHYINTWLYYLLVINNGGQGDEGQGEGY